MKHFIFIFLLILMSCNTKYSYYYSQTTFEKYGVSGYVQFDGKIFPVTNRFKKKPINLGENFIFLGRAKSAVQIPIDSLKGRPVVWPIKYKNY